MTKNLAQKNKYIILFTDLDGTLLNHHDYSYDAAIPALELLSQNAIPLVLCSSKTPIEISALNTALNNQHPFICENGSVIVMPKRLEMYTDSISDDYIIEEEQIFYFLGKQYNDILNILSSLKANYRFIGFSDMLTTEVMSHTNLDYDAAFNAQQRYGSEPLLWQDELDKLQAFELELQSNDLRLVKGGRFYHVMGKTDKSVAVKKLIDHYSKKENKTIFSIALGDSPNDIDMLNSVDVPIVIPAANGITLELNASQNTVYAHHPGAIGWNNTVIQVVNETLNR